ncbi:MAG: hypothetical protein AAF771_01070 [Pseudomonadota bacterium]
MADTEKHIVAIEALTKVIKHELEAVSETDPERLQELVTEKEALAAQLEAAGADIERLLRGEGPDAQRLRSALANLQHHLKRNSGFVSRMARSCAEIVSELTRNSAAESLRGLYDRTGKVSHGLSRRQDVDLSL